MKGKMLLAVVMMVVALGLVGAPATWAASITYQGVTFTTATVDSNTFSLTMTGLNSASGNWAGIDSIAAFGLKDLGTTFAATTLTLTNWTVSNFELNAGGCSGPGGGPNAYCFLHNGGPLSFGGSDTLTLNIDHTGTAPNLTSPHLKVLFAGADVPNGHGDLLSKNLTSVPEPTSLLLLGAGLAGLGIWRRKSGKV